MDRIARRMAGVVWLAAVVSVSGSHVMAVPAIDMSLELVETGVDPAVLAVREAAWRAYFAGDVKTLGDMLPSEFIGMDMNGQFSDRASTLAGARSFREQGGTLVSLTFPQTQAQRYGDVVVLYGRFEAVIKTGGEERTLRGRLTETFVRRDGTWIHPGWHLDLVTTPAAAQ